MEMRYIKVIVPIVIEPDEGGFHAYCPELKGLHVAGDTPVLNTAAGSVCSDIASCSTLSSFP